MGFFISKSKLKAATNSMHQFCPIVRTIYPHQVDEVVVEASTLFLYLRMSREIMGPRFTKKLAEKLMDKTRCPRDELITRVLRLGKKIEARHKHEEFHTYITRFVKDLLGDVNIQMEDEEQRQECFQRFINVVTPIRNHMEGIKRQNDWVLQPA